MTIEQRTARIRRELAKANKEADTLRDLAHQSLNRMAAETENSRNNSFWAAISIFAAISILSFLLMVLAGAGVATLAGG